MEIFTHVRDRVFGAENPFEHHGPQLTPEQQKIAGAVVADLEAGRFNEGLGTDARTYRVTDRPSSWPDEAVLEPASLKFDSYRPVRFPPIAMAARISGDVRLRLTVVPATGIVTDVAVVSGAPLLNPDAAAAAARTWRLAPRTAASDQIDVTLKFQLSHCND
jgi:TonB family protein